MAYVNVLEWRSEQVAEWLQGLDDSIYPYAHSFLNNNVTGRGLLNITVDDLYKLQVEKVGHQEIILEALEHLRNLHHNLDTENLQYVCLKLSCKARSLCNEIRMYGPDPNADEKQEVDTPTASSAADVMDALWVLVTWLDRPPFNKKCNAANKEALLKMGVELATNAFRGGAFAGRTPVNTIRDCCESLANVADALIRDVDDPLILQPASLDIATVRRKPNDDTMDFGLVFEGLPLNGVHVISEVRFQSPAHQCARIHAGDEVVQINYQTVVGWNLKKIMQLMDENPSELIVTLKKRPRHLPVFGQIYMKPFRIPARAGKKGAGGGPTFNNLPSPRAELLVAPNISSMRLLRTPKAEEVSSSTGGDAVSSGRALSIEDVGGVGGVAIAGAGSEDSDDSDENEEAFLPSAAAAVVTRGSSIGSCTGSTGGGGNSMLSPSKSPTQSVRSLLARPRSTPQRRATISGSSPSLSRPYINITEIWSCHARNIRSMDHSGGGGGGGAAAQTGSGGRSCSGSNSSTLQSNDSGHVTLSSSSSAASPNPHHHHQNEGGDTNIDPARIRNKGGANGGGQGGTKYLPRPLTVGGIMPNNHNGSTDYINMTPPTTKMIQPPKITTTDCSSDPLATPPKAPPTEGPFAPAGTSCNGQSDYINMNSQSSPAAAALDANKKANTSISSPSQKTPMPKPRTQLSTSSLASSVTSPSSNPSPNRKKPIPQPRSAMNTPKPPALALKSPPTPTSQKTTHSVAQTLKNLLPEKVNPVGGQPVQPVPTAEYQSFRRVQPPPQTAPTTVGQPAANSSSSGGSKKSQQITRQRHAESTECPRSPPPPPDTPSSSSLLPEYVNTTPPAVPARNPPQPTAPPSGKKSSSPPPQSRSGGVRPSEILQQSKKPSSRRFSGDLGQPPLSSLPQPPPPPPPPIEHDHPPLSAPPSGLPPPPPLPKANPPCSKQSQMQASKSKRPLLGKIPRGKSMEVTSMSMTSVDLCPERRSSECSTTSSSGTTNCSQRLPSLSPPPVPANNHGQRLPSLSPPPHPTGQRHPSLSPPPPPPSSSIHSANMAPPGASIPYYISDVVDRVSQALPPPPPPPPVQALPTPPPLPHPNVSLPPVFMPQTYNIQEMHQQRTTSGGGGIRRQMAAVASSLSSGGRDDVTENNGGQ